MSIKQSRYARITYLNTIFVLSPMQVGSTLAGEQIDAFNIDPDTIPTEQQVREFVTDHPHLFEIAERIQYLVTLDTGETTFMTLQDWKK